MTATSPVPERDPAGPGPTIAEKAAPNARQKGWLLSAGSMVLAFLASQHHAVMMLVLTVGLGDAAMGPMTAAPAVRRVMLAMSLVMAVVIAWRIRDSRHPRAMRVTGTVAILTTLALAVWTVARFGL